MCDLVIVSYVIVPSRRNKSSYQVIVSYVTPTTGAMFIIRDTNDACLTAKNTRWCLLGGDTVLPLS